MYIMATVSRFYSGEIMQEQNTNISSDQVKKKPIWKRGWFWIAVVFFICIGVGSSKTSKLESTKTTQTVASPSPITQKQNCEGQAFDIPSLLGKDLNKITTTLGTPKGIDPTAEQIKLGVKEWDKTFIKDGKELLVTYTITDGKIVDFFLSDLNLSGDKQNKTCMLELGNVKQNDSRYKVEFVKLLKDPSQFTGVKITPINEK
jgi:hypothetical protein